MESANQNNTDFIENVLNCFEDRIHKIGAIFNISEAVGAPINKNG